MESDKNKYWDEQHLRYARTDWIDRPTLFVQSITNLLHVGGKLLDAGCGQGADSRYFAQHGYEVTAMDFSDSALEIAQKKSAEHADQIKFVKGDLASPLPFMNASFDIVYSHLAVHYFSASVTEKILAEFERILKKDGVLALLVNSTTDPEFNTGPEIEKDYFIIRNVSKRFFNTSTLAGFTRNFETMLLDDQGDTYKDRPANTTNLIRFVGRKK